MSNSMVMELNIHEKNSDKKCIILKKREITLTEVKKKKIIIIQGCV